MKSTIAKLENVIPYSDSDTLTDSRAIVRKRPRRRCWSCSHIHCRHVIRELSTRNLAISQSNGTAYLRNTNGYDEEVSLLSDRSTRRCPEVLRFIRNSTFYP